MVFIARRNTSRLKPLLHSVVQGISRPRSRANGYAPRIPPAAVPALMHWTLDPAGRRAHVVPMPIYEYAPVDAPGCALCCYGFEILQRLADPALTHCSACGVAIHRVLGMPPVVAGQAHVLRERHVARHGFTQYRRVGKGKYEKTAGNGPPTISDD